jgi:hypothetical protein
MRLPPLFLVSLATVGIETALTRYFALASWSDYGYWVISIVMVGFALSGIVLSLGRDTLVKISDILLAVLPAALVISAALGYCATILNPFNPLQLQNDVTYLPQLGNIFLYYAALLPFFFLAGLFISLCFVLNSNRIGRVYAADLTGAGCGSILVLGLMYLCSPFGLIPALLHQRRRGRRCGAAGSRIAFAPRPTTRHQPVQTALSSPSHSERQNHCRNLFPARRLFAPRRFYRTGKYRHF